MLLLLSTQIDDDVADRYKKARWLILRGTIDGSSTDSTYRFFAEVMAYDLAGFFTANSMRFKQRLESILEALLKEIS
ncbi:MAG: hypothetical protein Q7T82_20645 [Armatimonadota bacterium]|nr:hypothetical protein [Armatimonadota bacterium]